MTTATITRKTRNLGYAHTDFGTKEYNAERPFIGPNFTGTPKQVTERVSREDRSRRSGGMILTGDTAWFLGDTQIKIDDMFQFELDQLVAGEIDSMIVELM